MKKKFLVTTVALALAASLLSAPAALASTSAGTDLSIGHSQTDVAFSPDGSTAYLTNPDDSQVLVMGVSTGERASISVGNTPTAIAISPDGDTAYVTVPGNNSVTVLDLANPESISSSITVNGYVSDVAFSPAGDIAYVTSTMSGKVSVIDVASSTVSSTTINVGGSPSVVTFSPNGAVAYVGDYFTGLVSMIDTTDSTVTTLSLSNMGVRAIAFTPDGSQAYVSHGTSVSVIDVAQGISVNTIFGAETISGLAISPDGSTLFVAESSASALTTYALPSLTPGDGFSTGTSPRAVAVSPDGTQTWVANGASEFVSVFAHDPALFPSITSTSGSAASIVAGPLTASLTDAVFPELTFSHDAQRISVETLLSADDQTGLLSGWNVTLQASDLVWTSPGNTVDADRNIPAGNLLVRSVTSETPVETLDGDEFNGQAVSSDAFLDSPVSVLSTEPGTGSGSYTVPLTLQLNVPANAATGTYTGTLTTTISAAP